MTKTKPSSIEVVGYSQGNRFVMLTTTSLIVACNIQDYLKTVRSDKGRLVYDAVYLENDSNKAMLAKALGRI